MHDDRFAKGLRNIPRASDPQQAADAIERWLTSLEDVVDGDALAAGKTLASDPDGHRLLSGIFGNSRHLAQCAFKEPAFALELFTNGPDPCLASVNGVLAELRDQDIDSARLARDLRRAKQRAALMIAVADITGVWNVPKVTATLAEFAEATLRCACSHALRHAASRGAFKLPVPDQPEIGSGLIVLGMGKLGARELNYSSDIDIIIFFDEERIDTDAPGELQKHFVRLARDVLRMMDERTGDGYVFRTDLRLRPDPGSTSLAVSARAGLTYYEQRGRDWERAAMIKARAIAGDREAGDRFLARLQPFIWRKKLDFAAIKEIHTIKRQIDIHKGAGAIAVAGHNVKLGRGGIREIEFFAQAQQLVWAGRIPSLRCRGTIDALEALVAIDQLVRSRAEDLTEAYYFLRRVEHRIQMINDEQTHSVPQDPAALSHLASFLGYGDEEAFTRALLERLRLVERLFIELFEVSLLPSSDDGALNASSFADSEPLPGNLDAISKLGFADPRSVDETVRFWYGGDYGVTRGERAREVLTELVPILLKAFGNSVQPDRAFQRFNELLSRIPPDIQFLSMLHANPQLVGMLANIMASAPNLVEHLCHHPSVLESVLIFDFFDPPPEPEILVREIVERLGHVHTLEDYLTVSRDWANDRRFQVAVQILGGLIEPQVVAAALSNIAEASIRALTPHIVAEIGERHGRMADGGLVVLDMGDLGAREMTWASHPSAILIRENPPGGDAENSIPSPTLQPYHADLASHVIEALSLPTIDGNPSEADMAGVFSNDFGAVSWSIEEFRDHFAKSSGIRELLALSRARVVAGPPDLAESVVAEIRLLLTQPKDPDALLRGIEECRTRPTRKNRAEDVWAASSLRREIRNLDLAVRYLQLRYAEDHPEILEPNTHRVLVSLRDAGLLSPEVANDLIAALDLWQAILGMLRIAVIQNTSSETTDHSLDALKPRLAQIADVPDFASATELLRETSERVDAHIRDVMGRP